MPTFGLRFLAITFALIKLTFFMVAQETCLSIGYEESKLAYYISDFDFWATFDGQISVASMYTSYGMGPSIGNPNQKS